MGQIEGKITGANRRMAKKRGFGTSMTVKC
jgi:hypothetical protein